MRLHSKNIVVRIRKWYFREELFEFRIKIVNVLTVLRIK